MSFDFLSHPDRPFHDGLAAGRFMIQTCLDCGQSWSPATGRCGACGKTQLQWRAASGIGTLQRTIPLGDESAFGDDPDATRAIGAVRLAEGPTVSVRIAGPVPDVGALVAIEVLGGALIARAPSGV
ncbi:zinc ribbon domain-containing protein [Dinoroseobacter sp. PD6]|uniref:Zn-ribbon domain-containing OB-fold protein n=1 Tax=Dinoroseobacter sp. PD6 TaxID=3028384 RepID=UPI00237A09D0|nr:OB-fold domain-containing protein [Dinoroseobacter sp. PD6]MDD9716203.1 zinc ribbon domain-containing protein [Dinoroseobacter sp. PD6]